MHAWQQMDNLADVVGGNQQKGGKRWRLVFTSGTLEPSPRASSNTYLNGEFVRFCTHLFVSDFAGKEQVSKAMKGEKAGGIFFPITAVQVCSSSMHLVHLLLY